jgi:DNA-binding GntR family transcriptional regulator
VADTVDEHAALVDAIAAGDPGAAEAAMRLHIDKSRERLLRVFH